MPVKKNAKSLTIVGTLWENCAHMKKKSFQKNIFVDEQTLYQERMYYSITIDERFTSNHSTQRDLTVVVDVSSYC